MAVGRSQDRTAFAALFSYFGPRLKTYFRRLGMVDEEAEELAQEAMILVWRKAALFDPGKAAASTWIYAIARNLRLDALRCRSFSRDETSASERPVTQDSAPSAEEQFASSAQQEQLRKALHLLPREQAQVVQMCYFGDRSHTEIARELSIPLGTVKGRLRLVLGRLRRALEKGGR
ncbi:sigma-70 family RNA polymerase sigma factor [Teichococcus vastitatis]|uniref:RNA polymerase sigma factor n=1 Tax=Teichococcus vastitatis TaxID=2307076 RepID=A0ABS9W6W5_9PROT|nr:sigma-70 family RNA polymerase sigma factor [Pseudoroseomonas vastitatis]MCI0755032.1 sigma-70 family RNA polymerase sigma factor [Pseudoroseomonas vastitatis]